MPADAAVVPIQKAGTASEKGDKGPPVSSICELAMTASPDTPVREIKQRIGDDQPLEAVVVVENGRPLGLVMSLRMDRVLSQRFGVSLYYEKPVSRIMDAAPLIVEGATSLERVAHLAMNRETARMYDHVIVVVNGVLLGTVSVRKILQTLADRDQQRTEELTRVNERLRTEIEERHRAVEALGESRGMLRLVIDSLPHAVFWKDRSRTYLGCNQQFARNAGASRPEEVIGKSDFDLAWKPEEAAFFRECDERVMDNDRPEFHIIEQQRQADGKEAFLDTNKIPLHDREGRVVGILGTYEDITEKIRDEQERTLLKEQLRRAEKMEAIGTMAGGVAHDLNNILSGIVSYPELLLMDLEEESPLRRPIMTIKESGERAAAIVNDLLTLTRRGVATTEPVQLNDLVRRYMQSPEHLNIRIYHPSVTVDTRLQDDLLPIQGSPVHLSKTLMNLLSNAAEAMPEAGRITVRTASRYLDRPVRGYDDIQEGDYTVLTVADQGVGIPKEDLDRIFEPFYTRKVMGRSGTGLGMAVVWGTVKDHNGYIDVTSEEGVGTTFTLYFPVARGSSSDEALPPDATDIRGRGETVLVIDDVEAQRTIATLMLQRLGYRVQTASSGEEACALLKSQHVDLLVLDMIMDPGMDGLDTYRRILGMHPGQKAVIASGFSETDRVREAQRLGAGTYVKKPYTLENLGRAVREQLDRDTVS